MRETLPADSKPVLDLIPDQSIIRERLIQRNHEVNLLRRLLRLAIQRDREARLLVEGVKHAS
jgi:hypothetical protein